MNIIQILEPRWHDKTVLVGDWHIEKHNLIDIQHKDFPEPFYLSGKKAKEFPLQYVRGSHGKYPMRVIPLSELEREVIPV